MVNRTLALTAHAASVVPPHWHVEVQAELTAQALQLIYRFPAADLRLPVPVSDRAVLRADDLWQHTCGELFVAVSDDGAYREFNFSPSGQWAAYDFVGYRQRSEALPTMAVPQINLHADGTEMTVMLPIAALLAAAASGQRRVGLTAVLEAADGCLSYWALAHPERAPDSRPDFHHRAGFTLEL